QGSHTLDDRIEQATHLDSFALTEKCDVCNGSGIAPIAAHPQQQVSRDDVKDAERIAELERQLNLCVAASEAWARSAGANAQDAERYRWLRSRPLNAISEGGVFIGKTPDDVVMNLEDADAEIDAAMSTPKGTVK